jgi:hypothetical protein
MAERGARPRWLRVTGLSAIIVGTLFAASVPAGYMLLRYLAVQTGQTVGTMLGNQGFNPAGYLVRSGLLFGVSLVSVVSGIALLNRHAWSRVALQLVAAGYGLLYLMGIPGYISMSRNLPPGKLVATFTVFGITWSFTACVLLLVFIRFLRRPHIRAGIEQE